LLRGNIFGLEKYFPWGLEPRRFYLRTSSQKDEALREAEAYAAEVGIRSRFATLLCTVVDELVSNAIYHAPVGQGRHAHVRRDQEVTLDQAEAIEVKLVCDGRRLGVSVADPFGTLTRERLLAYLSKCFRKGADQIDEKEGGAGLGLYCVFQSLSHLVVNISPGKQTEVVGLIDVGGSFRDFAARNKSFNVFLDH